ncbi:MAG: aminotransferase class III-fold pyridoxal phosphate-dependent enzyme [Bacteriovoracia bacterium]
MQAAKFEILKECFHRLPVRFSQDGNQGKIHLEDLKDLQWKGGGLLDQVPAGPLTQSKALRLEGQGASATIQIDLSVNGPEILTAYHALADWAEMVMNENPLAPTIWGEPHGTSPTGFNEKKESLSHELLKKIYADKFNVPEKKAFIIDLAESHGAYMVSVSPERHSIVDGAAQIASLTLGFNHPAKQAMALRPEVIDPALDLKQWDVYQAFTFLMKKESGFPHCYLVNSGAEANETALKSCQMRYPSRRRVIAFEGSFHGRSVLTLHATYNPSKRAPFEFCQEYIEFMPFPEWKTVWEPVSEPAEWISLWASAKSPDLPTQVQKLVNATNDPLLRAECESLLKIRESILRDPPLAVLIEPMLCEGGDRYGTKRYFRGLRLLTRALDTALVIDEVQTGLGLGGEFLWFKKFDLVDAQGRSDLPDALVLAKKAQVGVCLTHFEMDVPLETSAASIYRGYLQAVYARDFNSDRLAASVKEYLIALQKTLGRELIENPRGYALAFAFDVPSADIMNKLVEARFGNGTLFYPAGDQTLRFRLMSSTTEEELGQIFLSLYKCFLTLADHGVLPKQPAVSDWVQNLPPAQRRVVEELVKRAPGEQRRIPWGDHYSFRDFAGYMKVTSTQWQRLFVVMAKHHPGLLRSRWNREFPLDRLNAMSAQDLWKFYEATPEFTRFDLWWQSARRFGFKLERLSRDRIGEIRPQIGRLEKLVYEPVRQDDPEMFYEVAKDPKNIFLASFMPNGEIAGFSAAAPLSHFPEIQLVKHDPLIRDANALYSIDLSCRPEFQGTGLGFRLKCEQYMEAWRSGVTHIRSRNRFPEAAKMAALNRRISTVIVDENPKDYEGDGLSLYQSVHIPTGTANIRLHDPRFAGMKNKVSLANFVSENYVRTMLLMKEVLPDGLKHIYLASGRCEAIDKSIKLMRYFRPKAKYALSFEGDYFGATTAAARSLGGKGGDAFFPWPKLKWGDLATIEKQLDGFKSEEVFGLMVEPLREKTGERKSERELAALIAACRKRDIPIFFQETGSHFRKYDPSRLFCAGADLQPDGIVFYPGHQLGVLAVNDKYFLEKGLMMISTWDGDEHSFQMLREKVLKNA